MLAGRTRFVLMDSPPGRGTDPLRFVLVALEIRQQGLAVLPMTTGLR